MRRLIKRLVAAVPLRIVRAGANSSRLPEVPTVSTELIDELEELLGEDEGRVTSLKYAAGGSCGEIFLIHGRSPELTAMLQFALDCVRKK